MSIVIDFKDETGARMLLSTIDEFLKNSKVVMLAKYYLRDKMPVRELYDSLLMYAPADMIRTYLSREMSRWKIMIEMPSMPTGTISTGDVLTLLLAAENPALRPQVQAITTRSNTETVVVVIFPDRKDCEITLEISDSGLIVRYGLSLDTTVQLMLFRLNV